MIVAKPMSKIACLVVAVAGLAGCASNGGCARVQNYENAQSVPLIQGVDGLKIPESTTAMKVPPSAGGPELPFGVKVQDSKRPGKTRYQCLDQPPTIPASTVSEKAPT